MGTLASVWLGGLLYIATLCTNDPGGAVFQPGRAPGGAGRATAASACLDCHQFPDRLTHPIGVRVGKRIGLPLDAGGAITCATCHDPGQHKSGGARRDALRLPAPDLCRECHDESDVATRAEHAIAVGRAHFDGRNARLSVHGVDAITRECLGCHDGSVAAAQGGETKIDLRGSHPVGRRYDESSRSGQRSRLRPRQSLPHDVRLAGGTVGCQTCHSPYSREADMLTAPMVESGLCRACHDM